MKFGRFEKSAAIISSSLVMGIGASACSTANDDEPIRVPNTAFELGTMGVEEGDIDNTANGSDAGFLFADDARADAHLLDCSNHRRKAETLDNGDVQVICTNADDAEVIRFNP